MKIRMRQLAAGPNGIQYPGMAYEVSDAEGKGLIAGGYADPVIEPREYETTTAEPIREVGAIKPKKRKK
jgi:hypothetical protein